MSQSNYDKDKDPMEQLFHDKAKDFDIEYREDDWLALQPALNMLDAKAARLFWIRMGSAAAVILILIFGYAFFGNNNTSNSSTANEPTEQIAQAEENNGAGLNTPDESNTSGENIDNPGVRETDPISNNQASESDQNLNQNQNQNGDQNLNFDENVSETETLAAIPDLQEAQSPDSAVPSDPVSQNAIGLTEHSHFDYKRIPTGENLNTGSGLTVSGYSEYSTQHTFAAIREPDYVRSEQPFYTQGPDLKDARSTFEGQSSRLTVAIALSPDVTGAGTVSGFRDPGYKAGAFLEYALTKRLSVSVGIVQTEVNYKAPSSEYDPPYYWQPGTSPSEIIATCLMLDLPLTFKYNLFQFERSRIYSSATLSSYYMQNEEYQFRYSGATQGGPDGYNETGNKAYWFSNAGVSIGYEFDLNQTWSLRAEPFLRLPLREVGWGNARLYSMGTFISLNYRI